MVSSLPLFVHQHQPGDRQGRHAASAGHPLHSAHSRSLPRHPPSTTAAQIWLALVFLSRRVHHQSDAAAPQWTARCCRPDTGQRQKLRVLICCDEPHLVRDFRLHVTRPDLFRLIPSRPCSVRVCPSHPTRSAPFRFASSYPSRRSRQVLRLADRRRPGLSEQRTCDLPEIADHLQHRPAEASEGRGAPAGWRDARRTSRLASTGRSGPVRASPSPVRARQ